MTLTSVTIENFRSIKKIYLPIKEIDNKNCLIFLGKNENGKSNILKAVALLDKNTPVNYKLDCNKEAQKNQDALHVLFELSFDEAFYIKQFAEKTIPQEFISIEKIERHIDISKEKREDFFYVYLKDNDNFEKYVISSETSIIQKLSDAYSGEESLTKDNINSILPKHKILTKALLEEFIENNFFKLLDDNTPKVIFWQPSQEYLINTPIDLQKFKDNITLSIPLRNIFNIGKVENKQIKERIDMLENDFEERIELAQNLSEEITNYINLVWPEQKISIRITIENNLECIVNVEDKDNQRPKYRMDQRSDGFKQFISILLNLSAENTTKTLKNKIILLDEPEVHLHPSGIKYLRDELLRISKNNLVMIATHSTYMIDKLNLNRHYSVIKEKAITEINQIQINNPYEEEVIYESLGTSIFEHIMPNMIIFEGRTDKEIFDEFSKKFAQEIEIKNIASIAARGVDLIPNYVKFFNGKLVKGFVVVDSDKAGQSVKKTIMRDNPTFDQTNTFEINDLIESKSKKHITLEDLFPKVIIEECLKKLFNIEINLNTKEPFLEQIKQYDKTIDDEKLKVEILKTVVDDLNKSTIDDLRIRYVLYYGFIKSLYAKIGV